MRMRDMCLKVGMNVFLERDQTSRNAYTYAFLDRQTDR